jgi:hypothetical protein
MIIELNLVENNPEMFRRGFREWLMENAGIWRAFENEAERVWAKGRTHWSAHTIIEYLRHETMFRDASDEQFKISEQWTSSIARLYGLKYPERVGFFAYREGRGVVAAMPLRVAA